MRHVLTTIIAIIAALIALIALWTALGARKDASSGEWGNQQPNIPAHVDRVKDAAERAKMEQYVADLQAKKKVVKTFQAVSGETIDCVDIYAQPALKRRGMEGHQVLLQPTTVRRKRRARRSTAMRKSRRRISFSR